MTHLHINQDAIKEILIWRLRYTSLQWPTALYKSSATLSSLNNSHQSNNTHTIMHTSIFLQSALLKFPTLVSSSHFPGKSAAEGQQCVVKLTDHMAVQQCLFTDAQTAKPLSKHSLRHIHNYTLSLVPLKTAREILTILLRLAVCHKQPTETHSL